MFFGGNKMIRQLRLNVVGSAMFVLLAVLTLTGASYAADAYPTRPVHLIAPYAAGGTLDVVSRMLAQKLSESMDQPFVVEDKPGAGGNIGAQYVAKAPADGYTLLMGNMSTHAINQSLYPHLAFDPVKDFAPITQTVTLRMALVVSPSLSAKTVADVIALAKEKPDTLNFASGGIGTNQHLAGALFMHMSGTKMQHIPYKGDAPAVSELLSGRVQLMFANLASILPYVKSGMLRMLAVTSRERSPLFPDVPTVAETPGMSGFEVSGWHGLFAPAGTPQAVVHKLSAEVIRILETADMKEKLASQGLEPVGSTPEEFAAFQRNETAKWAEAVKISGAKME